MFKHCEKYKKIKPLKPTTAKQIKQLGLNGPFIIKFERNKNKILKI